MSGIFERAQNFRIDNFTVLSNENLCTNALKELEAHIAPEALHDSAERCDAPKCQPETRVAVQDDLYSWIEDGDPDTPNNNIKWVTGPAGTGKTAVMGSVTERCKENGIPVASFFFSSTGSIGRRTKTAFVTTIAHQLAQHRQDLKDAVAAAFEADHIIFKKNLHVQMETLILAPLRAVAGASDAAFRGVIVIDGLDECEVEKIHDKPTRTNEQDQLEILQVLQQASLDPAFPFRILIASRPERVFREFFDPQNNAASFSRKLDLHEDYNADADIILFLEVHFDRIRRRYNLPPSWLPPDAIEALVKKASGQFIYAATVVRFLETDHQEPPKALLEAILKMETKTISNSLEGLDALYLHILESSPDPHLSVQWIQSIHYLSNFFTSAFDLNMLLQTDPESNEAEHLLGNLHSLIRIPPPSEQATTRYTFYHKSLIDFLCVADRCRNLYKERKEISAFHWNRFNLACTRARENKFSYPESFLGTLACFPYVIFMTLGIAYSWDLPSPATVAWWLSLAIAQERPVLEFRFIFRGFHGSCSWYRCKPACTIWSRSILRRLGSGTLPGRLWVDRPWFTPPVYMWFLRLTIASKAKTERRADT